jgi:tetratricopeptide (TPR) repeat protein
LGQYPQVKELASEALSLIAENTTAEIAKIHVDIFQVLGNCATETNSFSEAEEYYRQASSLAREMPELPVQLHNQVKAQLVILAHRARLLRNAITFATLSVLSSAVLIIVLFVSAAFRLENAWLILLLFVSCMGALIVSLIIFLMDLNQSLIAFKLDIGQ